MLSRGTAAVPTYVGTGKHVPRPCGPDVRRIAGQAWLPSRHTSGMKPGHPTLYTYGLLGPPVGRVEARVAQEGEQLVRVLVQMLGQGGLRPQPT